MRCLLSYISFRCLVIALCVDYLRFSCVKSEAVHNDVHNEAEEDTLHEVVEYLVDLEDSHRQNGEPNVTIPATLMETLLEALSERMKCPENRSCASCVRVDDLYDAIGVFHGLELSNEEFGEAAVVLVYKFSQLDTVCKDRNEPGAKRNSTEIVDEGLHRESFGTILHNISIYYEPSSSQCFDVDTLFDAVGLEDGVAATDHEIEQICTIVIWKLLQGHCIGPPQGPNPASFIESIFHKYGSNGTITEESFDELLEKLGIGSNDGEHTEEMAEDDGHAHRRDVDQRQKRHTEDETHYHHGDEIVHAEEDDHHGDDEDHHEEHENNCYSGETILSAYDIDHDLGISSEQFMALCPALIQQLVTDACLPGDDHHDSGVGPTLTKAESYGYGSLSVFIISLLSLLGVVFIPVLTNVVYTQFLQLFIGLGIGTLAADAFLHLIPEAYGIHGHSVGDSHDHEEGEESFDHLWKSLTVLAAIYVFFVFEKLTSTCAEKFYEHSHEIGQDQPLHRTENYDLGHSHSHFEKPASPLTSSHSESKVQLANLSEENDKNTMNVDESVPGNKKRRVSPVVWIVILGDTLHNVSDGLAIGAAFAANLYVGISTSIAVFCHELPHELGDFAILLNGGLSFKKALLFNFISALSSFIGLYIGIAVGADDETRRWIFAITAGIFLYVALVDLMPEALHFKSTHKLITFILQNFGVLAGFGIMVLIAIYEEELYSSFN